jgi:hypothetical protein
MSRSVRAVARAVARRACEGDRLPEGWLSGEAGIVPLVVPYDAGGSRERLVYLSGRVISLPTRS